MPEMKLVKGVAVTPIPQFQARGVKYSLDPERFDYSRGKAGALPFVDEHDENKTLGYLTDFWYDDKEDVIRHITEVPMDTDIDHINAWLKEYDAGLKRFASIKGLAYDHKFLGYDEDGDKVFSVAFRPTHLASASTPVDIGAKHDNVTVSRSMIEAMENYEPEQETTEEVTDMGDENKEVNEQETPKVITAEDFEARMAKLEDQLGSVLDKFETFTAPKDDVKAEDAEEDETESVEEEEEELVVSRSLPKADDGEKELADVRINPMGRVPKHDDCTGLSLSRFALATSGLAVDNWVQRSMLREYEWIERNYDQGIFRLDRGESFIPYAVLAQAQVSRANRASKLEELGMTEQQYLETFYPAAEKALALLGEQEVTRTLTTAATSAGAGTGVMVDVANSIMWLNEMTPVMSRFTMVPGVQGEYRFFYGNAKPTSEMIAEGADLTETNPTLQRAVRTAREIAMYYKISTRQMSTQTFAMDQKILDGARTIMDINVSREMVSGPEAGDGTAFTAPTVAANHFDGLMHSGLAETSIGGALNTVDRADMISALERLVADEAADGDLGWLLSNELAFRLSQTKIESTFTSGPFIYQDGMVDCGIRKIGAVRTRHIGNAAAAEKNFGALFDRNAALALFWGPGIESRGYRLPGESAYRFDQIIPCNFAFVNAKRGELIYST